MTVKRSDFVYKFMRDCGLTYAQACRAYDSMVGVVEDGITNGFKIGFGKVGALVPHRRPPRAVSMNCEKSPAGTRRVIELGPRIVYRFTLYKKFVETHPLKWFNEPPMPVPEPAPEPAPESPGQPQSS